MSQYHPMPERCADTVPVKVNRVFDSCSDRDCFSNVQILMDGGELPANVTMVKSRCVRVSDICMNIDVSGGADGIRAVVQQSGIADRNGVHQ